MNALNKWWKEINYAATPVKAGTVIPAETITSKTGRVIKVPRHVQTKEDAEEQSADFQFVTRNLATVRGFSVHGETVTVETNLSDGVDGDYRAREICRSLGGFVWANENRHYELQDIKVVGTRGEILSSRIGLGAVR